MRGNTVCRCSSSTALGIKIVDTLLLLLHVHVKRGVQIIYNTHVVMYVMCVNVVTNKRLNLSVIT